MFSTHLVINILIILTFHVFWVKFAITIITSGNNSHTMDFSVSTFLNICNKKYKFPSRHSFGNNTGFNML